MRGVLLRAGMLSYRFRYWYPIARAAHRPDIAQRIVLTQLLRANRDSKFGVEHRFNEISDPVRFRSNVPVQDYETLRGRIDEQRRTGVPALTVERPIFYAQTSGSTGVPKYIPVTASILALHKAEQALFTFLQHRACPEAFSGSAFGIMGAAVEGHLDSGHPVGSVSGYLYESLPASIQSRFVVPPEVSRIADYDMKYLVILRLALARPDISYLGSPNPSTFLRLLEVLNDRRELLLGALETGAPEMMEALDAPTRAAVAPRLAPSPVQATRLRKVSPLTFANVWPGIRLVTTWTSGSCGIALGKLRTLLPSAASVMELGYQATECRGTMALDAETSGGLPPLHHHFFEFIEQECWDRSRADFLTLDQLEPGKRYYVLITTAAGLYRYFMNDLVEVTGFFHKTPLLRFVQKGKGVTSLTGEKVYEAQVIEAVQQATRVHGLLPDFFLLVAEEERSAYRLFLEIDDATRPEASLIAANVDRRLGELNIEYHGKRASGRLGPLTVAWLKPGAADAYKVACVRAGQREGQFKPAVLQYGKDLALSFDAYVVH